MVALIMEPINGKEEQKMESKLKEKNTNANQLVLNSQKKQRKVWSFLKWTFSLHFLLLLILILIIKNQKDVQYRPFSPLLLIISIILYQLMCLLTWISYDRIKYEKVRPFSAWGQIWPTIVASQIPIIIGLLWTLWHKSSFQDQDKFEKQIVGITFYGEIIAMYLFVVPVSFYKTKRRILSIRRMSLIGKFVIFDSALRNLFRSRLTTAFLALIGPYLASISEFSILSEGKMLIYVMLPRYSGIPIGTIYIIAYSPLSFLLYSTEARKSLMALMYISSLHTIAILVHFVVDVSMGNYTGWRYNWKKTRQKELLQLKRCRCTNYVATCSEDVTTAKERDEDSESVASFAPSMHSIIDDVPRTPKKQTLSVFDPRNQSIFTEALYVSIGLAVIGLSAMVAYRFIRGRR